MNNKVLIAIVASIIVLGGIAAFAVTNNNTNDSPDPSFNDAVNEEIETDQDRSQKDPNPAEAPETSVAFADRYVTLAEYNADQSAYAERKKVLFFHADWCPTCRAIEKEVATEPGRVPEDVILIETDYDSETSLRQKYGVTTQTTFVQIDNNGDEVAQWYAPTLDDVLDGIQ